jgi:hypothetical protein
MLQCAPNHLAQPVIFPQNPEFAALGGIVKPDRGCGLPCKAVAALPITTGDGRRKDETTSSRVLNGGVAETGFCAMLYWSARELSRFL